MNCKRQLSDSFSAAVLLTSLAHLLYDWGGEFLALPGLAIEFYLFQSITITVWRSDYTEQIPIVDRWLYNVMFYGVLIFMALLLKQRFFPHKPMP